MRHLYLTLVILLLPMAALCNSPEETIKKYFDIYDGYNLELCFSGQYAHQVVYLSKIPDVFTVQFVNCSGEDTHKKTVVYLGEKTISFRNDNVGKIRKEMFDDGDLSIKYKYGNEDKSLTFIKAPYKLITNQRLTSLEESESALANLQVKYDKDYSELNAKLRDFEILYSVEKENLLKHLKDNLLFIGLAAAACAVSLAILLLAYLFRKNSSTSAHAPQPVDIQGMHHLIVALAQISNSLGDTTPSEASEPLGNKPDGEFKAEELLELIEQMASVAHDITKNHKNVYISDILSKTQNAINIYKNQSADYNTTELSAMRSFFTPQTISNYLISIYAAIHKDTEMSGKLDRITDLLLKCGIHVRIPETIKSYDSSWQEITKTVRMPKYRNGVIIGIDHPAFYKGDACIMKAKVILNEVEDGL